MWCVGTMIVILGYEMFYSIPLAALALEAVGTMSSKAVCANGRFRVWMVSPRGM